MIKKFLNKDLLITLGFGFLTFVIYTFSHKGEGANWNYHVLLADAILHGRVYLLEKPSWLNELVEVNNHFFVVYPPMPSLLAIPFVAIFGKDFYQPLLSILLGSANVALSFLVFLKFFKKREVAIWLSVLFGFGSIHWYHAQVGSSWYLGHITSLFFLWLSLLEIVTKQRLFLIGLLIGFSYWARLPTILSAVFVLIFLQQKFINFNTRKISISIENLIAFGSGLSIMILVNTLYNYLRFGVPYDIAYQLLPIFDEPWYRYGLFNIKYIPIHLEELFTALPIISSQFPFITPSINVMAFWVTTPAFLLILFSDFRTRLGFSALITVIFLSLPGLMHGSNGFSQFGFRFMMDYFPFLFLILGTALYKKINIFSKLLIILSIIINLWGVVMISHLNLGRF